MRSDARTAALDGRVRKGFRPLLPQPIADARRNLHFFTRVSFLFASYKSFQAQTRVQAWITRADQAAIDAAWSKQHDWGGRALYRLACDLKGYHLKGCQWLGSRPDIAPPEFVLHLSKLQDRCPPLALSEVEAVIDSETGSRLAEAFSEFDEEPLGSASIAQVHSARLPPAGLLRRRKKVAVKVQRPGARYVMLRDLAMVKTFLCHPAVRRSFAWDPAVIMQQVEGETRMEFDFEAEASAMDSAARVLNRRRGGLLNPRGWLRGGGRVAVPRSIAGMVTPRLLVMERLDGLTLSRLAVASGAAVPQAVSSGAAAASRDRLGRQERRVARRMLRSLGEAYGQMLFEDGFGGIHADPHPGNILLAPSLVGVRVGLVDWGQTKTFDLSARLRLARLTLALSSYGDADGRNRSDALLQAFVGLGVEWDSTKPESLQHAAAAATAIEWFDTRPVPSPFSSDPTSSNYPMNSLGEITAFPVELVYLVRCTQILRALGDHAGVEWSLADAASAPARRLLRRHGGRAQNWDYTSTRL